MAFEKKFLFFLFIPFFFAQDVMSDSDSEPKLGDVLQSHGTRLKGSLKQQLLSAENIMKFESLQECQKFFKDHVITLNTFPAEKVKECLEFFKQHGIKLNSLRVETLDECIEFLERRGIELNSFRVETIASLKKRIGEGADVVEKAALVGLIPLSLFSFHIGVLGGPVACVVVYGTGVSLVVGALTAHKVKEFCDYDPEKM